MPSRIQRSRAKGWRLPPNSACCTRPGRYGNPFAMPIIHHAAAIGLTEHGDPAGTAAGNAALGSERWTREAKRLSVEFFRSYVNALSPEARADWLAPLIGKDHLACFCPLDDPYCHVEVIIEALDVLVEIANG